ncbi:MAG: glycosyltransferase family 2 protein [Chloroflexi bacterium]|nr:glycosyltransferase family 2 protein [Chloroflexota bacterium]MCI0725298.1 glycosyltransferase family 2 protein [Chloroflexota bacterium]
MDISVIIPTHNEEGNLALLHQRLTTTLFQLGCLYELVFVDDGSTDRSLEVLEQTYTSDRQHVKVIKLQRNYGKTTALVAGFQLASGNVLITMDADLQDDPADIPAMLEELNKGYDLVVGWRKERMDRARKRLSSRIFNLAVSRAAGLYLHDFNCGFKVYRRQVLESVRLYSDLHRYIPVLAAWQGFRVSERPVTHHPRHSGVSKYGTGRIARGFMDLVMVLFIVRYLRHPLRLFGWLGFFIFSAGGVINVYFAFLWLLRFWGLAEVPPIGTRPLFSVAILAMILGVQLISIGLLGEMIRYFSYEPKSEYAVSQTWQ